MGDTVNRYGAGAFSGIVECVAVQPFDI